MLLILSLLASAGQSIVADDVKLEALLQQLSDDLKRPLVILSLVKTSGMTPLPCMTCKGCNACGGYSTFSQTLMAAL